MASLPNVFPSEGLLMADRRAPSFGQLLRLLTDLGFTEARTPDGYRVYRHLATDTVFVFADRSNDGPAREADVVGVRRQLTERGLIDDDDFQRFLAAPVRS